MHRGPYLLLSLALSACGGLAESPDGGVTIATPPLLPGSSAVLAERRRGSAPGAELMVADVTRYGERLAILVRTGQRLSGLSYGSGTRDVVLLSEDGGARFALHPLPSQAADAYVGLILGAARLGVLGARLVTDGMGSYLTTTVWGMDPTSDRLGAGLSLLAWPFAFDGTLTRAFRQRPDLGGMTLDFGRYDLATDGLTTWSRTVPSDGCTTPYGSTDGRAWRRVCAGAAERCVLSTIPDDGHAAQRECAPIAAWPVPATVMPRQLTLPSGTWWVYSDGGGNRALRLEPGALGAPSAVDLGPGTLPDVSRGLAHDAWGGLVVLSTAGAGGPRYVSLGADGRARDVRIPSSPCASPDLCGPRGFTGHLVFLSPLGPRSWLAAYVIRASGQDVLVLRRTEEG